MTALFTEGPESSLHSEAERKSKRYYDSCIDKNKTIEKTDSKPLLQILTDIGGWSLSNTSGVWNSTDWNFQDTLQKIHLLDTNPLFNMWVSGDDRNSSRNILQVSDANDFSVRLSWVLIHCLICGSVGTIAILPGIFCR